MTFLLFVLLEIQFRVCDFGYCKSVEVTPEVIAITSCESGDGHNWGTIKWDAVSHTNDTGAFQFNDLTWEWLSGKKERAKDAPQSKQLEMFYKLWNNGYGWKHWVSSKGCWGKWATFTNDDRVLITPPTFDKKPKSW